MKLTIDLDIDLANGEVIDDYVIVARVKRPDKTQTIVVDNGGDLDGLAQIGLLHVGSMILMTGNQLDD